MMFGLILLNDRSLCHKSSSSTVAFHTTEQNLKVQSYSIKTVTHGHNDFLPSFAKQVDIFILKRSCDEQLCSLSKAEGLVTLKYSVEWITPENHLCLLFPSLFSPQITGKWKTSFLKLPIPSSNTCSSET